MAVKVVSLDEIESAAKCFEKNRINLDKWTQLFYPKPDDKHGDFSMRPIDLADYEVSVNIDSLKMPMETRGSRQSRDYRRPDFLTWYTNEEYHHLYYRWATHSRRRSLTKDVYDNDNNSFLFPTRKFWKEINGIQVSRFANIMRLHWLRRLTSWGNKLLQAQDPRYVNEVAGAISLLDSRPVAMAGPVQNPGNITSVLPKRLVDLTDSGIWADFLKKSNEAWTAAGQTNYPRPRGTKGEDMSKPFKKSSIRD